MDGPLTGNPPSPRGTSRVQRTIAGMDPIENYGTEGNRLRQPANDLQGRLSRFTRRQRPWVQRVAVTSVAVTAAWLLGSYINGADGLVAAIMALITLRMSLQASVMEGALQLLGAAVGVIVAFVSIGFLGSGTPAVFVTVVSTLAISRLFRLGDEGSINIGVTALIVLGPGMAADSATDRVLGTLIGVAVALTFSFYAHPLTPVQRTQQSLAQLSSEIAELLSRISNGILTSYNSNDAAEWLTQSREMSVKAEHTRSQAEESLKYSRWSPNASRSEAEAIYTRFIAIEHTLVQVRTIARGFYDAALKGTILSNAVSDSIGGALAVVSDAVGYKSEAVEADPGATVDQRLLEEVRVSANEAAQIVKTSDDTQEMLLGASVLTNIERITDSLELTGAAINEVATPIVSTTPVEQATAAVSHPVRRIRQRRSRG